MGELSKEDKDKFLDLVNLLLENENLIKFLGISFIVNYNNKNDRKQIFKFRNKLPEYLRNTFDRIKIDDIDKDRIVEGHLALSDSKLIRDLYNSSTRNNFDLVNECIVNGTIDNEDENKPKVKLQLIK